MFWLEPGLFAGLFYYFADLRYTVGFNSEKRENGRAFSIKTFISVRICSPLFTDVLAMFWQNKFCFYNGLPTSNMRGRVPIRSGPHFGVHISSYQATAAPLESRAFTSVHIGSSRFTFVLAVFWQI